MRWISTAADLAIIERLSYASAALALAPNNPKRNPKPPLDIERLSYMCVALSGICACHRDNQDAAMAAFAVDPLVSMLQPVCRPQEENLGDENLGEVHLEAEIRTERSHGQANAAAALAELARDHPANQVAIAETGCIDTLISLLMDDCIAATDAAAALWRLSAGQYANQQAVAEASGIWPLVALLGSEEIEAQVQAAGALAAISQENQENEEAIAIMLVGLLKENKESEGGDNLRGVRRRSTLKPHLFAHTRSLPPLANLHTTALP